MESQAPKPQAMPPLVDFILTRRLPCAAVMTAMLLAMWLPIVIPVANPAIALLLMMLGMALNLMTPALVALVTFGGGFTFALHVAAISAAAITLVSGFSLTAGIVTLLLYGLLPILSATAMMQENGIRRSAEYVAIGSGLMALIGLLLAAAVQDTGVREWIDLLLAPMFAELPQTMPAEQMQAMQMFRESMVAVMPALLVLALWMTWWGNTGTARHWAKKFGFYRGSEASMLTLGFGKTLAYLFVLLMLLVMIVTGDLLYLVANAAIVIGGLLAAQGVAVAHSWLKAKGLTFSIGLMYLMLLIWSAMIVPFVIVGLMDIWFDYRRNIPAAGG
ncbi:putative membrane protein (DUF2232) [Mariprofundus ferrinatatus]|uniref:Putative membrane protein (DUF2232) n=1 Tax=Mariprofundus ferrinatatus TaxID=1921087 RepID=A0A2K8LDF7_9PROT|nr:DUF2232 domain-containing protein [Mariprofundus ferrinatatus]ATX82316.1 putative membrane protein (DUF2232) [Mariprofundus ferrinatatus]